jgi:cellobiose phosphorylase
MPKLNYLRPKHKRAIEMRWQSIHYDEIASEVGVTLDAVKSWFRANGFLREAYNQYAEDQILIRKLQDKQERINTLNRNIQQQSAVNSLDLPIQKVLQKLSPKDRDGVMKRFNELNREAEKKINTLNGIKRN